MSRQYDIDKWGLKIPNDLVCHADMVLLVEYFEPPLVRVGDCDWVADDVAAASEKPGWYLHTWKVRGMPTVDAPQSESISAAVARLLCSDSPHAVLEIVPTRLWAVCVSSARKLMDTDSSFRSLRIEKDALQMKLTEAQAALTEAQRQAVMHQNFGRMMEKPKTETPEEVQKRSLARWVSKKPA